MLSDLLQILLRKHRLSFFNVAGRRTSPHALLAVKRRPKPVNTEVRRSNGIPDTGCPTEAHLCYYLSKFL